MKKEKLSLAENEFRILNENVEDPIIAPFEKEILALVNKFGGSGQSGGSAHMTASAISQAVKSLCLQEPLYGITGEPSEFKDNQNIRLSSVFKDEKDEAYYLDAIVFKGQNGSCFTSSSVVLSDGVRIKSRQYIKHFPFKPKTFYIDVIETEWADKEETEKKEGGGWWTSIVKDKEQLNEVFRYYKKTG